VNEEVALLFENVHWECSMNTNDILWAHCDAPEENIKQRHPSFVKMFSIAFGITQAKIYSWLKLSTLSEEDFTGEFLC
jgi:hypothetical protein